MELRKIAGVRIYVSDYLTLDESSQIERTWLDRLFSKPWRPWRRFKTISKRVPNPHAMQMNVNGEPAFIMHPQTFALLQQQLDIRGIHENKGQVLSNCKRVALARHDDQQHESRCVY